MSADRIDSNLDYRSGRKTDLQFANLLQLCRAGNAASF
jgi:hypothetical protein